MLLIISNGQYYLEMFLSVLILHDSNLLIVITPKRKCIRPYSNVFYIKITPPGTLHAR